MMTPSIAVRFQKSRHQGMSYRSGSRSVMLVCPQRSARRCQGIAGAAGAANAVAPAAVS